MNKIRKQKSITIFNDEYVKKEDKDNEEIYDYLDSRDFHHYLKYQQRVENASYYPYIKDLTIDNYQKGEDLINITSELHNKTSYNKEITKEKYKKIHDNISGYVNHLDEYYYKLLESFEVIEYASPSQNLFLSNYSKLLMLFDFIQKENDSWYALVQNKNKERICLNHGNLCLEHLIKNDKAYLISWDKSSFDSPILDIVTFYHNEWENLEFSSLLNIYLEKCKLTDEEKKLLFLNLAIPKKIKVYNREIDNIEEVRKLFDYIFKTEELLRTYYSEK